MPDHEEFPGRAAATMSWEGTLPGSRVPGPKRRTPAVPESTNRAEWVEPAEWYESRIMRCGDELWECHSADTPKPRSGRLATFR
jgi:hypothetical protein